jgi:hypothetical protein
LHVGSCRGRDVEVVMANEVDVSRYVTRSRAQKPFGSLVHFESDASGSGWQIRGRTVDCAPGFMSGYSSESGRRVSL